MSEYSKKLPKEEVDKAIQIAFNIWGQETLLKFAVDTENPDITIFFAEGRHGDLAPFDGPRGVLAHAFYPNSKYTGDLHIDDSEPWVFLKPNGGLSITL